MSIRPELILASGSPYKRKLLEQLAIPFACHAPAIDESRGDGETPRGLATRLAREKAAAVAHVAPDSYVLGCDQVIALEERTFSKPGDTATACDQLQQLQGKTHQLINAIHLLGPDGVDAGEVVTVSMTMRPLSPQTIKAYVEADQPLDCAGAYRIESQGIKLFSACRGDDPSAIEGLPLIGVWNLLLAAGVQP